ncbi:helix-turn-helix domain-containing protein [Sphingomonas sp. PvP015]|uniref:helix-turn-helix domain-containing protein n=1 Tax=Sphingomonas sp. PvP015 TaxID=3156388 RepID=UPI00339ACD92
MHADYEGNQFVHRCRLGIAKILTPFAQGRCFIKLNVSVTLSLCSIRHSSRMKNIEDHPVPDWQVEGTLAAAGRAAIIAALLHCENSRTLAAKMLNCGRSTLYRKMADYGIEIAEPVAPSVRRTQQDEEGPVVLLVNGQYILMKKRELA